MSKQSEAKEAQGYQENANCSNCANYLSDTKIRGYYYVEHNIRCGIGGFEIKKTATCEKWEPKNEQS